MQSQATAMKATTLEGVSIQDQINKYASLIRPKQGAAPLFTFYIYSAPLPSSLILLQVQLKWDQIIQRYENDAKSQ